MGIFGWDYPPGCHSVPGDEPDPPCDICGGDPDGDCICPECPECGANGDPICYDQHGLVRSQAQIDGLAELKVEQLAEDAMYDRWAEEHPEGDDAEF